MKKNTLTLLGVLIFATSAWAQGSDSTHRKVYEKTRKSIVAIRARAPLGERSGTGVFLDDKGTILTSYSVCPEGSTRIRVWTEGPRLYSYKAKEVEIIGHSKRDEITILRIKPREGDKLHPITFGKSSALRVGDVAYTSGNAANSIINDNQPSFNLGVISGLYRLNKPRSGATYKGMVIETTAAVNVKMEGAPLLDRKGRMVGFVTLNYSPHRFLGCAIPIDGIMILVKRIEKDHSETGTSVDAGNGAEGYLGLKLKDEKGRVVVSSVKPDGPADHAGLEHGDVIVAMGQKKIKTVMDFNERIKGLRAGSILYLVIEVDGEKDKVKLIVGKKP